MNEVNGVDTILLYVTVCLSVSSKPVNQTSLQNGYKATDFKFDTYVSSDSPDMTPYFFSKTVAAMVT